MLFITEKYGALLVSNYVVGVIAKYLIYNSTT
jgi:hypothetical protein